MSWSASARLGAALLSTVLLATSPARAAVRLKDLARIEGAQETMVLGYGLVVGLSGTGDSSRSLATSQTVSNLLRQFGVTVPADSINSRNVAAVLVTASLPPYARVGDHLDVTISSSGDASSLSGGTLLLTELIGADRQTYAVAQGALAIGGFKFEQSGSLVQKNHATAGTIPEGALIERPVTPAAAGADGAIDLLLIDPDYTTAQRVCDAINHAIPSAAATTVDAGRVRLHPGMTDSGSLVRLMANVESLSVEPSIKARVVVNERTGTIVSGGNVWISAVSVAQGDIRVAITQHYLVSQPGGVILGNNSGVRTAVVPEADVSVNESDVRTVSLSGATIDELVTALRAIRASSRDVIAILQGIKRAGALHAELIVQ